jgi:alkylation response protein AidB-like acyl-CoA dehydrogenase
MDLGLTETQEMLKRAAQDFLAGEAPREAIVAMQKSAEGLPPDVWRAAAELGWLGILIPERYGGSGGSFTDAAVLFQELGKGPLPGPFFESGVLSALVLLEGGSERQRSQLLPRIAEGSEIVVPAITEPEATWGPHGIHLRPERAAGDFVLSGTKLFAVEAQASTRLLVPVRTGDGELDASLLLLDRRQPGVRVRVLPGFLSWQCEVTFDDLRLGPDALVGAENEGWSLLTRAMEKALPVHCAYAVGGCEAVFDMSVRYSETRVQFGVPG